ncbi:glycosyltransferase [Chloroflexales bacterium ZM16-3]|nr:glycosyltransferase [Chloroflexales bacterium ZM16-3]
MLVNSNDRGGGASRMALDLLGAYRAAGHDARMLVGDRRGDQADVEECDHYGPGAWADLCARAESGLRRLPRVRGRARAMAWLRRSAIPARWADHLLGRDLGHAPYTRRMLAGAWRPDVIHLHNLTGDFFDLAALAPLSRAMTVIWTLHDAWAITGHCAYPINCERWRAGCGSCPDLHRPPAIMRDGTAANYARKGRIYAASRLAVATPSQWLMGLVEQSQLRPWQRRVIANGVDLATFRPGDRAAARAALGLPRDAFICIFVAYGASTRNPYKDLTTVERAVALAAAQAPHADLRFICVGRGPARDDDPQVIAPGYIADQARLALYYQAADLLLHATRADNAPCVIAEALACGTAVLATDVGGIGEMLGDGRCGWLVPGGDAAAMALQLLALLADRASVERAGQSGAAWAAAHYNLGRQAGAYLDWFAELRAAYGEGEQIELQR